MSEQLSLMDPDANEIGKFQRSGAAVTQRLAALSIYPHTGTDRRRVLDFVASRGEWGATDDEMQQALRMNPSTQRPRRVELRDGGWIEQSGRKRRTLSRRAAVVWVLTARGRAAWSPAA